MPLSEVNNNSLGTVQAIRPPQYQLTNPNPINPAPFFQALQFNNQAKQLELQKLDQSLREKQLDFQESNLLFQQTKEILDHHNAAFENLYETNKQKSGTVTSPYGNLGLDTTHKLGLDLQKKFDAASAEYEKQTTSKHDAVFAGNPNSKDLNRLLYEMNSGESKLRQNILEDPTFRELTGQTRQYSTYMSQMAEMVKVGYNVDQRKVDEIKGAYERLQNGDDYGVGSPYSKLKDQGSLNRSLAEIPDHVFDAKTASQGLQKVIEEAFKPVKYVTDEVDKSGLKYTREHERTRTLDEATPGLVAYAKSDPELKKMFSAVSGLYDDGNLTPDKKQEYDAKLTEFVRGIALHKAPLKGFETRTTDGVSDTIYDPQKDPKVKEAAKTDAKGHPISPEQNAELPFKGVGKDTKERAADKKALEYVQQGYDISSADASDFVAINDARDNLKTRNSVYNEVQPDGSLKVWQIEVDKAGMPVINEETDANGKTITHFNKIGEAILTLPKKPVAPVATPNTADQPKTGQVDKPLRHNNPFSLNAADTEYDTMKEGFDAGVKDTEAKIQGDSNAMKTSPYMLHTYGAIKASNYADFATVKDLINVRTPSTVAGNQTDAIIKRLEAAGIPKDTKLADIKDDQAKKDILYKEIVKGESRQAYDQIYGPQPMPTQTFNGKDITLNKNEDVVAENLSNEAKDFIKALPIPVTVTGINHHIRDGGDQTNNFDIRLTKDNWTELQSDGKALNSAGYEAHKEYDKKSFADFKTEYKKQYGTDYTGDENTYVAVPVKDKDGFAIAYNPNATGPHIHFTKKGGLDTEAPVQTATESAVPPHLTPDQASILNTQVFKNQAKTIHPALEEARSMYLKGEQPNVDQTLKYLKEAGLNAPSGPIDNSSGKPVDVLVDLNNRMRITGDKIQEIKDNSKETNKQRIRRGLEPIALEDDNAFSKLNDQLNNLTVQKHLLEVGNAEKANATLIANTFKTEADQSYKEAAKTLEHVLDEAKTIDLNIFTDDNLDGTIKSYGSVDPDHFLLTIGGKQKDITREELHKFIEDHAKVYAFEHTNPVDLAKAKIAPVQSAKKTDKEIADEYLK